MQENLLANYSILGTRADIDVSSPKISKITHEMIAYMRTITTPGGDYSDYDPDLAILEKSRSALQGLMINGNVKAAAKACQNEIDRYERSKK